MRPIKAAVYDDSGRMRLSPLCAVYAIVADQGDGVMLVKIGFSSIVYERYATLLPGIPFESTMLWAHVGPIELARKVESSIHLRFAGRRIHGEWFRFSASSKNEFHVGLREVFFEHVGKLPSWQKLTESQVRAFVAETRPKPVYEPKRGKRVARSLERL